MADKENPRTTADHFEFDEEKALPVSKFFKTYKNRLPMLAIIIEGIYGLTRYDSYDCFQVIRVHCYTAQPRVVCMKEDDAIKKSYRYITIPVRTGLLYRVVKSRRNQSQPMTMEEILNKYALPSLVEMEPQEKQVKVKVGNSIRNLGRFLLLSKYEENYLKQNCIDGDDLEMNSTACMLNMNDENTVTPITGFKNRSKEEFERYLKKLAKQAAEDPEQYNTKDGNPDSTEHILSETTYGSASIPTTMRPEEALRMIRSFQSEPLPALPPLPPGEIPSSPALPPRRPLPSPSSQSTGSAPLKQMIVKDGGEDDDDSSDYEVPLENPQECPKLPPRGSFKKQSSASVKEPRDRDKLMAELVLKMNRDTKPNDKPGESCPKLPKRPVMKPPDPTGVSKKEERRKDGYENTKIGRAVVRPQQIVTMDNEYEVADIFSVPEVEPDICISEKSNTSGSPEMLQEDDVYVEVREVQLPPTPTRDQQQEKATPPVTQPKASIEQRTEESKTRTNLTRTTTKDEESFTGVKDMTIAEVATALRQLRLGDYVKAFQENCIDGQILSELSVDDFVRELKMRRLEAVRLDKFVKQGHVPR